MEDAVFLRSALVFGETNGGDMMDSLGAAEVFLDNQANGLVSFRVGAGAGAGRLLPGWACGGGAHGTEGSTPDSPWREGFEFLVGRGGFEFSVEDRISFGDPRWGLIEGNRTL